MAITQTSKLGLPQYSSGTDPHPGRVDHNGIMMKIESGAMGVLQGLHSERPGAGVAGRVYFSTDRNTAAYDNGTGWVELVPLGGVAPSGVRAGATGPALSGEGGSEGTSARVARADHTHAIPLASDTSDGLLAAETYAELARMTDAATPSTLVKRDSAGRFSVSTPTVAANAANKSYVDQAASNASNLASGTVPVARLPLATASAAGAMSAAHYSLVQGATAANTPEAVVRRNSYGNIDVNRVILEANPKVSTHATHKGYVDAQVATRASASHSHDASEINSGTLAAGRLPLASATAQGAMSSSHYVLLNGATSVDSAHSLLRRNSAGDATLNQLVLGADVPTSNNHATRKDYVDGKKWDGSDITSGTISPLRIANATASLDGLMPKADKAKLDKATASNVFDSIVYRNAVGNFSISEPGSPNHAATKAYVDGRTVTGQVSMDASANVATTANITFPAGQFSVTPAIVVTPYGAQGSFDGPVTMTNVSLTGATINFTRKIAGTVVIAWAAIA